MELFIKKESLFHKTCQVFFNLCLVDKNNNWLSISFQPDRLEKTWQVSGFAKKLCLES